MQTNNRKSNKYLHFLNGHENRLIYLNRTVSKLLSLGVHYNTEIQYACICNKVSCEQLDCFDNDFENNFENNKWKEHNAEKLKETLNRIYNASILCNNEHDYCSSNHGVQSSN